MFRNWKLWVVRFVSWIKPFLKSTDFDNKLFANFIINTVKPHALMLFDKGSNIGVDYIQSITLKVINIIDKRKVSNLSTKAISSLTEFRIKSNDTFESKVDKWCKVIIAEYDKRF